MTKEQELKQLLDELSLARTHVQNVTEKARACWHAILKEKYGIEEGAFVKYRGALYKVSGIRHYQNFPLNKPWVTGNLKKKEGTFSKIKRHLFDEWELVNEDDKPDV